MRYLVLILALTACAHRQTMTPMQAITYDMVDCWERGYLTQDACYKGRK